MLQPGFKNYLFSPGHWTVMQLFNDIKLVFLGVGFIPLMQGDICIFGFVFVSFHLMLLIFNLRPINLYCTWLKFGGADKLIISCCVESQMQNKLTTNRGSYSFNLYHVKSMHLPWQNHKNTSERSFKINTNIGENTSTQKKAIPKVQIAPGPHCWNLVSSFALAGRHERRRQTRIKVNRV